MVKYSGDLNNFCESWGVKTSSKKVQNHKKVGQFIQISPLQNAKFKTIVSVYVCYKSEQCLTLFEKFHGQIIIYTGCMGKNISIWGIQLAKLRNLEFYNFCYRTKSFISSCNDSLKDLPQPPLLLWLKDSLQKGSFKPGTKQKFKIFSFLLSSCRASQNEALYQFLTKSDRSNL